ncbi:MAG: CDP-alcohol phosphatidyltransferase family protein [Planctomycetota bacterium]
MARLALPRWLPNAITLLRIALIPAFVAHAHWCDAAVASGGSDQPHRALALAALLGIGVSDVVDGFLARRYGLATPLGATLDAVADKLAQVALLLFFATTTGAAFARVPIWFVALVLGRDVVLAAGSLAVRARRGRVEVVHERHGRLSSLLLFALLVWITADLDRSVVPPALVAASVLVVLSTVGYVRDGWRQWRAGDDA